MALKKSYTDGSQTTHPNAYWRLVKFYPIFHAGRCRLVLFIYHDEDARRSGAEPVGYLETWVGQDDELPGFTEVTSAIDGTSQGLREYLYTILKEKTELEGAEDILESSSSSSSSS